MCTLRVTYSVSAGVCQSGPAAAAAARRRTQDVAYATRMHALNNREHIHYSVKPDLLSTFLRAIARSAKSVLAIAILSVCLSVCHDPVQIQAEVR